VNNPIGELKTVGITIFSLKTWQQTGATEKTTYKMNCKWLIIKWTQLGSNLDLPWRNGPVDHSRQGLDWGGARVQVGTPSPIFICSVSLPDWIKKPSRKL